MYQLKILFLTKLAEPSRSILKNWILSRVILHGRFNAEAIELGNSHQSQVNDLDTLFACTPGQSPGNKIINSDALIFLCDQNSLNNLPSLKNLLSPLTHLSDKTTGIITCYERWEETGSPTNQLKAELRDLKAVIIDQCIHLPCFNPSFSGQTNRTRGGLDKAVKLLLDHMIWWTEGLKPIKIC